MSIIKDYFEGLHSSVDSREKLAQWQDESGDGFRHAVNHDLHQLDMIDNPLQSFNDLKESTAYEQDYRYQIPLSEALGTALHTLGVRKTLMSLRGATDLVGAVLERNHRCALDEHYSAAPYLDADNQPLHPPVWNQGGHNSCTAFATAYGFAIAELDRVVSNPLRSVLRRQPAIDPSRAWIYYWARKARVDTFLEHPTGTFLDNGCYLTDAILATEKPGTTAGTTPCHGVVSETDYSSDNADASHYTQDNDHSVTDTIDQFMMDESAALEPATYYTSTAQSIAMDSDLLNNIKWVVGVKKRPVSMRMAVYRNGHGNCDFWSLSDYNATNIPANMQSHTYIKLNEKSNGIDLGFDTTDPHYQFKGWHAVDIMGYDDSKEVFKVRNSWGAGHGDNGYFYLPYSAIHHDGDKCVEFWWIEGAYVPYQQFAVGITNNILDFSYRAYYPTYEALVRAKNKVQVGYQWAKSGLSRQWQKLKEQVVTA